MLSVQQLALDEGPRLRSIRLRSLLDAPDAFGSTLEETAARSAQSWSKQLLDLPTFVAVSEGLDVGIVRCARDVTRIDAAWLISMWVAPEMRRRGVGGMLVDAVIDWARANGVTRLILDVVDTNESAIAFYMRKGFERNGNVSTLPPPREHITEHQRQLNLS
jgi:GNAT superfamily N-acetyltransferase